MARKIYADLLPRRVLQMLTDALFIATGVAGYLLGNWLADGVRTAQDGATSLQNGAKTLADNLTAAGQALGNVPFIGSEASKPINEAATSAGDVSTSGQNLADGLERTASILGPLVTIGTLIILTLAWLLTRGHYVRRASRVEELSTFDDGLELLKLEAKLHLPPKRWRGRPASQLPDLLRADLGLRPLDKSDEEDPENESSSD